MLASGRVKVKHGVEIEGFDSTCVCFTDGTTLSVDAVIFACVVSVVSSLLLRADIPRASIEQAMMILVTC